MMLRRSRSELGAFKISGALWTAAIGAVIYFAVMYAPVYGEVYEVRSVLQKIANKHFRGSDYDPDKMKLEILQDVKEIGGTTEITEGKPQTLGGIVLLADDVFITRDDSTHTMILQVNYTRYIKYPFIQKNTVLKFSPTVKIDTSPVNWKG
jgi:hypothetical protein